MNCRLVKPAWLIQPAQWCLKMSVAEDFFSFYLYFIKQNCKTQCRLFIVHATCQAVKRSEKSIIDRKYLLPLKHYNFVSQQVTEIQLLSFFKNIRVFAHQQPANVSKEETPASVVRVSVRLWIFVVNPVVSSPFKDIILWVEVKTDCIMKAAIIKTLDVCLLGCRSMLSVIFRYLKSHGVSNTKEHP